MQDELKEDLKLSPSPAPSSAVLGPEENMAGTQNDGPKTGHITRLQEAENANKEEEAQENSDNRHSSKEEEQSSNKAIIFNIRRCTDLQL